MSFPQEIQYLIPTPYFLSNHSLSDELEQATFLSLIVGISHFSILWKNLHRSHLIVISECPQTTLYTHILRYFNNFPLIPFV